MEVSYSNAESKKDCFNFFGGCAYEILNHAIKAERLLTGYTSLGSTNAANANMNVVTNYVIPFLHDLVDPTGDVDIEIRRPRVKILNELHEDPSEFDYKDSSLTDFNEWFAHWTNWLYENVVTIFKSSTTRKAILPITEPFDIMTDPNVEGEILLKMRVDNIWILLLKTSTMLKVQIMVKLKGVSHSDHIFEMVIVTNTKNYGDVAGTPSPTVKKIEFRPADGTPEILNKTASKYYFDVRTMNLPNVRIQSFYSFITDNREALVKRLVFAISQKQHKFYNHIQRLKYLTEIIPYFVTNKADYAKNPYLSNIADPGIVSAFNALFAELTQLDDSYGIREEINPICLFDYKNIGKECTLEKVEDSLFGNMVKTFTKMLSVTERFAYTNVNSFIKRHKKPSANAATAAKPMYPPMMRGSANARTRRRHR